MICHRKTDSIGDHLGYNTEKGTIIPRREDITVERECVQVCKPRISYFEKGVVRFVPMDVSYGMDS